MGPSFTNRVFPPFRLDPVNQCLWREDVRITLAPKTFAVLRYLVENPGRLITQEEMLGAVWPGTYVQPEILRKYILDIRKALGDPPKNPLFVETLPRRGYRFIARVAPEMTGPSIEEPSAPADPLVGREHVLGALNALMKSAMRGQREVVFLTGEAGIGKTTVVDAFEKRIAVTEKLLVARGQCVEGFAGKEAYYPLLEALGQLLRGPAGEQVLQILSTYAPASLIQFPFAVKPERREALQREIIGVTRERMVRELCEALERLAANQSLVLILEDLHWVDDSTLDVISALARRRGSAKLLLLGTYRPGELILSRSPLKSLKQDLLVRRLCHELPLEPLTESEVGQFLEERFPDSPSSKELRALIHRRSDGNPMFMVAMAEQVGENGKVEGVPPTLQQMIEIQLEQLSETELELLRAASVVGPRFSAWSIGCLLDGDAGRHEAACEQLAARQQFVKRAGVQELPNGSESLQYEFKHGLYREVLYRQIPATRLRAMHVRLAEGTEAVAVPAGLSALSELAVHFEEGRSYERAVKYLVLAAAEAARRYSHADSLRLLQRALELLPQRGSRGTPEIEVQILEKISDALYAQGDMEQSATMDRKAIDLAAAYGLGVAQVNGLTRLARALAFLEPDRCIAVCEQAVEIGRTLGNPLLLARAEMLAGCWRIVTHGLNAQDAAVCAAARRTIRGLSSEVPAYYEILYAHVQCIQGDYQDAYETAQAGIPKAVEEDNLVVYLSAHSSLAQALVPLGRIGELQQVFARAIDVAAKNGNWPWLGIFMAAQGWMRLQMQDFDGARRIAEELLGTHQEEPGGQVRTTALVTAAFADLKSGHVDKASPVFAQVCERPLMPRFFLDWHWRLIARFGLAMAWLAKGELSAAAETAEAVAHAADSIADPVTRTLAWDLNAQIAMASGQWDRAKDALAKGFDSLGSLGIPTAARKIHATAAEYYRRQGDSQTAKTHDRSAAQAVSALTRSLSEGDPLRNSLLSAEAERRGSYFHAE